MVPPPAAGVRREARPITVDIGALCLPGGAHRIKGLVDDATAHGAWVVTGGSPYNPPGATGEGGQFFPPTLILVPDPTGRPEVANMRLLQEEVFGPLITVIPFTSEEQVSSIRHTHKQLFILLSLTHTLPLSLSLSLSRAADKARQRLPLCSGLLRLRSVRF